MASFVSTTVEPGPVGAAALALLPSRLSPSRADEYANCPRRYQLKTLHRLPDPPTVKTAVGTLAHTVFEQIFDRPGPNRTLNVARSLVAPCWAALVAVDGHTCERDERQAAEYRALAPVGSDTEHAIVTAATTMVENWFAMERVAAFDPHDRELALTATVDNVTYHGILDRLDVYTGRLDAEADPRPVWVITDYKTGMVPKPAYEAEAFRAMALYARLLWEQHGIQVDVLRLVYVQTGDPVRGIKSRRVTPVMLANATDRMAAIHAGIVHSAETGEWPATPSGLCRVCPHLACGTSWLVARGSS